MRTWLRVIIVVVALGLVAAGAFAVGRRTGPVRDRWAEGESAGYDYGVSVGRSLQAAEALPKSERAGAAATFRAGYIAGQQDNFGSFDGGWGLGVPYVVVLEAGLGGAPYRVASRDELVAGEQYWRCAAPGPVCHSPRARAWG